MPNEEYVPIWIVRYNDANYHFATFALAYDFCEENRLFPFAVVCHVSHMRVK